MSLTTAACGSDRAAEEAARPRRVQVDHPGLPLRGIADSELERFKAGDALFEATLRPADGLGPLYIRDACSACHASDGRGPGLVIKLGVTSEAADSVSDLLPFGNTERPYVAAGAKTPLVVALQPGLRKTARQPPAVFGRGYLEAIATSELERLEAAARVRRGSARGRLHRLPDGSIGRFGIKARISTLYDFTADALVGDMGVTSPSRAEEPQNPDGQRDDQKPGVDFTTEQVEAITEYVRLLELPERRGLTLEGAALFTRTGCATCHVPKLEMDAAYPVAALAGKGAEVYTDLLLHDMGEALADGVTELSAGPREFRTPPLIGLRFLPALLHDGRADTVEAAILAHAAPDSEGRDSAQAFLALTATEREALLRFVEAL